jgi:hypothetical protein
MTHELNPEDFRAASEIDLVNATKRSSSKLPRHQPGAKFLKGPIPWEWMHTAITLPGKALHIGILLWLEAGMKKRPTVRLNLSAQMKYGISRKAARAGIQALQVAKLIEVKYHPGQMLEVTLLGTPNDTASE